MESRYQAVPVACPHLNSSVKLGKSVEAVVRFVDCSGDNSGRGLIADAIMCTQYDDEKNRCKVKERDKHPETGCEYRLWKGFR